MVERLTEILTLVGLLFDLCGAVLVLYPEATFLELRLVRIFRRENEVRDIMKAAGLQAFFLRLLMEGLDDTQKEQLYEVMIYTDQLPSIPSILRSREQERALKMGALMLVIGFSLQVAASAIGIIAGS